jgi:regulator of nucleoside diphosphate kinase
VNDDCILLGLPDYRKLSGVVKAMKAKRRTLDIHIRRLDNDLETADIVEEIDLPSDVVSIGSTATTVDMDTGERLAIRLVFPADLDGTIGTVSVFSPLGVAVVGERAGAIVSCMAPSGEKRFAIRSVTPAVSPR